MMESKGENTLFSIVCYYKGTYMVKEIYEKRAFPVMALRNLVVFPEQTVCFEVGRPKSIKAIRNAVDSTDRLIFLVTQKDATV